jgi:hypothetical protein
MQMFILLPPLFSIMFHGHGPAGGDAVAAGSEIGSEGKRIALTAAVSPRRAAPMSSGRSERLPGCEWRRIRDSNPRGREPNSLSKSANPGLDESVGPHPRSRGNRTGFDVCLTPPIRNEPRCGWLAARRTAPPSPTSLWPQSRPAWYAPAPIPPSSAPPSDPLARSAPLEHSSLRAHRR